MSSVAAERCIHHPMPSARAHHPDNRPPQVAPVLHTQETAPPLHRPFPTEQRP